MNTNDYIGSGVLELYVFGQLSDAERKEVEDMCARYPEVQAELRAIEASMDGYARSLRLNPDPELRSEIFGKLYPDTGAKVVPMKPNAGYRWLAAASVALCIISGSLNAYLYNRYQNVTGELAALQTKNNVLADNNVHLAKQINAAEGIISGDNRRIELSGKELPVAPTAKALVFWDYSKNTTYINTEGLPPLDREKQYQLWAIIDGQVTDLGVLPKEQAGFFRAKDAPRPVESAFDITFAITIEPKGGSRTPTRDQMIVLGTHHESCG